MNSVYMVSCEVFGLPGGLLVTLLLNLMIVEMRKMPSGHWMIFLEPLSLYCSTSLVHRSEICLRHVYHMSAKNGWRVELSHNSKDGGRGGGRARSGGDDLKCYQCGEPGHFARECRLRIGPGGTGSGRRRSPSPPRYRRSPSYGHRSYSPRGRTSPGRRSYSPRHGRSHSRSRSRSPAYRSARDSPYSNGDRRRSRS